MTNDNANAGNGNSATGTPAVPVLQNAKPLPAQLEGVIDLSSWANSLANGTPYTEPDPEALSRMLLVATLTASTADDVFANNGVQGLQEAIPNAPGAGTGLISINGIYVSPSDQQDGLPCYMILDTVSEDTGMVAKYTTGAGQLQAQMLRLISLGVWPIRCKIVRLDRKDKGGRYLFWLFPPD